MSDNITRFPLRSVRTLPMKRIPQSKLGALMEFMAFAPPVEPAVRLSVVETAEAVTLLLGRLADECSRMGHVAAGAAYRQLEADADLLAKRIEAPSLEVETP